MTPCILFYRQVTTDPTSKASIDGVPIKFSDIPVDHQVSIRETMNYWTAQWSLWFFLPFQRHSYVWKHFPSGPTLIFFALTQINHLKNINFAAFKVSL